MSRRWTKLRTVGPAMAIGAILGAVVLSIDASSPTVTAIPDRTPVQVSPQVSPHPGPPGQGEAPAIDPGEVSKLVKKLADDIGKWGDVGVAVIDLETGQVLGAERASEPMNPASNAKIFTAIAALDRLGPDHRFVTGAYGDRKGDRVETLVLRGRGDPTFETADFLPLARDLKAAGVRSIGAIAVDQSYFVGSYVPPAFDQQPDEWAPFRANIAPLSVAGNAVTFFVQAARSGQPASIVDEPPGFVVHEGRVRTGEEGGKETVQLALEGSEGGRLSARWGGELPEGSRLAVYKKRVDDPRLLAGYAFASVLDDAGIEFAGEIALGGEDEDRLLTSTSSDRLGAVLLPVGKDSDNFVAEMVFRALAEGGPSDRAAAVVEEVLRARNAWDEGMKVTNGSGLFDANRATADATARVLRSAARDARIAADFISQLAVAGSEGTMEGRLERWSDARAIRVKTGTLAGVVALSGYVFGADGQGVAFAILANRIHGHIGDTRRASDRFVDKLATGIVTRNP